MDTKKRELVGSFRNPGTRWDLSPRLVNDHDVRSDSTGVAIPYGTFDLANRGSAVLGVSHDTPTFAAHAIAHWWRLEGSSVIPVVVTAIAAAPGKQNFSPNWPIPTASLSPSPTTTGASKWNPIEHRLFSENSKNWAGEPLDSYQKILRFIRSTRTQSGLSVNAHLDRRHYPTGTVPTLEQLQASGVTQMLFR